MTATDIAKTMPGATATYNARSRDAGKPLVYDVSKGEGQGREDVTDRRSAISTIPYRRASQTTSIKPSRVSKAARPRQSLPIRNAQTQWNTTNLSTVSKDQNDGMCGRDGKTANATYGGFRQMSMNDGEE